MKWLLIALGFGIFAWVLYKGKSAVTAQNVAPGKIEPTPGSPTTPAPTNTMIVTDQITSTAALGKAVADAAAAGQPKVIYNSVDPISVDVPSVVAAANITGQSVQDWFTTQFAGSQVNKLGPMPQWSTPGMQWQSTSYGAWVQVPISQPAPALAPAASWDIAAWLGK